MKRLAIGCGIAALLCALVIAGLVMAWPRIKGSVSGWVEEQAKAQREQEKFEATWQPPTPQPSDQWFPEELDGWKRLSIEAIHELPEVDVTRDGYAAVYAKNGHQLELKVIPVTPLEKDGLFQRAAGFKARPENSHFHATWSTGSLRETTYGHDERLYVQLIRDWFLLIHTLNGPELKPFASAWVRAIDHQPPPLPTSATPTPEAPR